MALYGYGEDALTYWALTERLAEVLTSLGDETRPEDAVIFYRPSFGRGAGGSFGEFDAIVATAEGIYLIETKWSRSGEIWGKEEVQLRSAQLRRHRVLGWYFREWRAQRPASWDDFREANRSAFQQEFRGLPIPHGETTLALNLQFVLGKLGGGDQRVRDVLLYADIDGHDCPSTDLLPGFEVVHLRLSGADRSGFFALRGITPPAPVG